jgi:hypothetical protein
VRERYCYWSVVDGDYARMMQSVVDSARAVGVFKDFHVWTDQPIDGAICHRIEKLDKNFYLFKLRFLQDQVRRLNYDYFVWLDADTWFVRNPGDLMRVMQGAPVHSSLESDACFPENIRPDWWGCSLKNYSLLMRFKGVRSASIFNVNAGFWIVHHDAVNTFCELALDFWEFCMAAGFEFTEEPPLAYATHMLCGNPYLHTLRHTADLWASDWTGCYAGSLPDGQGWEFVDYFSEQTFKVNPAIVHAMRSKEALMTYAQHRPGAQAQPQAPKRPRGAASAALPTRRQSLDKAVPRVQESPHTPRGRVVGLPPELPP